MDTNYIWVALIGFVAGIIMGRTSTNYRLFKADELVRDAGILLERTKKLRDEMEELNDELKRKGCFIREDDSTQD